MDAHLLFRALLYNVVPYVQIIIETLSTFRQNRQIGLGGFYGEQFLKEPEGKLKEPAKQLRVVESLLLQFLKDWTDNFRYAGRDIV